jgi:hypothetical protein
MGPHPPSYSIRGVSSGRNKPVVDRTYASLVLVRQDEIPNFWSVRRATPSVHITPIKAQLQRCRVTVLAKLKPRAELATSEQLSDTAFTFTLDIRTP